MFHIVYISSAIKPFSESELVDLLITCRERNSQKGITGMLLYNDGNFMQIIEGEEAAVKELYAIIGQDPRHNGHILLIEEQTSESLFGEWSMAFRNLTDQNIKKIPGFSRFMDRTLIVENFKKDPTGCLELMKMFRDESR